MFWIIITLMIMLGIGIPIIQMVYYGFTNSTNGTMATANISGTPLVTDAELALWRIMTIIFVLMILGFLFALIGGRFKKQ